MERVLLFMYLQLYIKTVLSILSIKFCVAEDFPTRLKCNQPRILHGDGQLNFNCLVCFLNDFL